MSENLRVNEWSETQKKFLYNLLLIREIILSTSVFHRHRDPLYSRCRNTRKNSLNMDKGGGKTNRLRINFISGLITGIIDDLLARDIDYLSMGRVTRGIGCTCIALCIYACQRMRPTCGCALTHASKLRYNVAPANCSALPTLFVSRPDGHESIRNHPRLRSSSCFDHQPGFPPR